LDDIYQKKCAKRQKNSPKRPNWPNIVTLADGQSVVLGWVRRAPLKADALKPKSTWGRFFLSEAQPLNASVNPPPNL
jgi:hypothetical protein